MHPIAKINILTIVAMEEAEETILLAQAAHLMHSIYLALLRIEEVEVRQKVDIKIEGEVRARIFVDSQQISQHHMTRIIGMTQEYHQLRNENGNNKHHHHQQQDLSHQEDEVEEVEEEEEEEDQARKAFQEWKFN